MTRLFTAVAGFLVERRNRMPRWARRILESASRNPDGAIGQLTARLLGSGSASVTQVPDATTRVYVAPTNYAGQGFLWARALESSDASIAARNMAVQLPGGFAFPADTLVPIAAVNASASWGDAEWQAARQFTHVLVEAERSMFGKHFDRDLEAEILALESEGVSVAFICHGTDIRDTRRHQKDTPWSPYPEDPRTETLQSDAERNLELLQRLRRPTFVSTPDLLRDAPWAIWCPVVVDSARFATDTPLLTGSTHRVIHLSSDPLQKGSDRIAPALASLTESGSITLELVSGVPSAEVPGVIASADIVLDQFRLGSYGVAACEAMAAGRIVVGHVLPHVREQVRRTTGLNLPILEATPDTLHDVISDVLNDPATARRQAMAGPEFVAAVHSGTASAQALIEEWIRN